MPLGLVEIGLRTWYPVAGMLRLDDLDSYVAQARSCVGYLQADAITGHAPVLGGVRYDDLGLMLGFGTASGTAERVPGVERILFLGDSVTARGRIIESLRALRPTPLVEYLNAGVEGWNPIQEVEFYFRQHLPLQPDHVVLTLHNNDFMVTRTALYDRGSFTLCHPDNPVRLVPWLYRASWIYRLLVNAWIRDPGMREGYLAKAKGVEAALQRLRDDIRARGSRLTVVVFPVLSPRERWGSHELESHRLGLEILERLAIETIDLTPLADRLSIAGVPLRQEPADVWHPGGVGGALFAQEILAKGWPAESAAWIASDRPIVEAGGIQKVTIAVGPTFGGHHYRILGSDRLARPPIVLHGMTMVLEPDRYFEQTLTLAEPTIAGGAGVLDADGHAVVEITAPRMETPGWPGLVRWHVGVVLGADGQAVATSSALPLIVYR